MSTLNFLADNPNALLLVMAILSLFIGSFLNVVIYRLPRMMEQGWSEECRLYLGLKPHTEPEKINLCLPFSHCPQCKKHIRPLHNIPLLSYLWLRGKCAYCHARISIRYPLVEALTCVMSVYVTWRFGVSWSLLAALLFTWIIISLTFIDLDFHLLPDQLTLTLLWLGLLFSLHPVFTNSHDAILGAISGYLLFAAIQFTFKFATGKTGMGQGDYKFLAAQGAFLGWQSLPLIVLLASLSGLLFTLTHMVFKRQFKSVPLPFGPYLALAGWIAMLWGNDIMQYYFQLT
ncbi:MAG: methyltransferase [Gammaproteobacteria bacterium RIFCSPHIGHO2_12_FULL_45_12]|nr:MAG: methyltransferase [Gammaproteobacteria bacterium RIFCSPHIGHO2_12_FULL_45_12]